jgi:xylulokinase
MFTSAVGIFSVGTSFAWVKENICSELKEMAQAENKKMYDLITALTAQAAVDLDRLLFNPSLAGRTSQNWGVYIRGAYWGLI